MSSYSIKNTFMRKYFFILFLSSSLFSSYVANPYFVKIPEGFFFKNKFFNMRFGYLFSNMYQSKYKDKYANSANPYFFSIQTQSGMVILNFFQKMDFIAMLGNSKIEIDKEIFTDNHFSFCVGSKILLLQNHNLDFALDVKYFRTKQDTYYFLVEKKVFPIITEDFGYLYEELQGSLAASYKIEHLIPYAAITYLHSTIEPYPLERGLIRYPSPMQDTIETFLTAKESKNVKIWGAVLGTSFYHKNFLVNIEGRFFDQNAVHLSSEIRF